MDWITNVTTTAMSHDDIDHERSNAEKVVYET